MARLITREFNPAVPVIVRRFFVAAGRHWEPGDVFEWQRLSVAQRRVKQLFDAGKLMHEGEAGHAVPREKPKASPAAVSADPAPEAVSAPISEAPVADDAEPEDDLTHLDMKQLREIAERIGAPSRVSRAAQRQAIRETRA
jgi:hypothetical protein